MMQHTTQDYEFLTIILFLIHTLFIIIAQKQGIIIPCFQLHMYLKRHGQYNTTDTKDKGYYIKGNTRYPRAQAKLLRH